MTAEQQALEYAIEENTPDIIGGKIMKAFKAGASWQANNGGDAVELVDCIHNLMSLVDTPVGKRLIKGSFSDEVREQARGIMQRNGRKLF